jgi:amino acid transporter
VRNTEERVLAVRRRAKELERRRRIRNSRILGASAVAASLTFIVGCSLFLPGVMAGKRGEYRFLNTAASIFQAGGAFGHVLIGLTAFVLGVGVTILCYRVHLRNQSHSDDAEDSDG